MKVTKKDTFYRLGIKFGDLRPKASHKACIFGSMGKRGLFGYKIWKRIDHLKQVVSTTSTQKYLGTFSLKKGP